MNKYREILQKYWGYDDFRGVQKEIIESIGNGKDTLGLMPTGGGKSITFQVPALAQEGVCIVITPLIALMKDQVENLKARGIKATAIYSGMTQEQILIQLDNCIFGNYKFLYVSPERISTDIFQIKLKKMKVSMITVDESHCISQWGYDFRPSYLHIADIRKMVPQAPVLALTATATPLVVKDIQYRLGFKEENLFQMSFERTNLIYVVRNTEDKRGQLLHILRRMKGSAIVYVRNRKRTKEIAEWLRTEDISAEYYHAGVNHVEKDIRQQRWKEGESRVMVATNAFGMGIDKPDVRIVIHIDLPDSVEAYFQEAGRAGRDGDTAYAVMLYDKADISNLKRRVQDRFPSKDYILTVYEHIQYYYQMAMGDGYKCIRAFDIDDFCRKFKHFPVQVDSALRILTQAGYLEFTDEQENASRLMFTVDRNELYKLQLNDEESELILQTILRSYTGLFSEFAYINEDNIASLTGTTRKRIYHLLVYLTKIHILKYIPQKKTPYIIYTQERQELKNIFIPKEVYEERREQYAERIEAMIHYATSDSTCRSRILLRYFGEKNDHNCGKCDVCLQQMKNKKVNKEVIDNITEQLDNLLSEKEKLELGAICDMIVGETDELERTIRVFLENEKAIIKDGWLVLKK